MPLTDFMPPAEAARAMEILGREVDGRGDGDEVDPSVSANVFHTRHAARTFRGTYRDLKGKWITIWLFNIAMENPL